MKTPLVQMDTEAPKARSFLVAGYIVPAQHAPPGLYVVATPIGHLGDITLRALETLAGVDVIACEDTRVTRRLLDRYGISVGLIPYHEHNAASARPKILDRLASGQSIALVSDAGTPLISDPGFKLVREVSAAGAPVFAVPGASSVLTALSLAALPTDRFFFEGFLPSKEGARRTRLTELSQLDVTLVLFESGNRVRESLQDIASILGSREAAICREMTKLHEDIRRSTLADLAAQAAALEVRGEFVLVIGPPAKDADKLGEDEIEDLLRGALARGSLKDAVTEIVAISGHPRRIVYARALELSKLQGNTAEPDDER